MMPRGDLLSDMGVFPPEDHSVVSKGIHALGVLTVKSKAVPLETNFTMSPFALFAVLSMASEGAVGETKEEILSVILSSRENPRFIHKAYREMLETLSKDSLQTTANGMILRDNSVLFVHALFVRNSIRVGNYFNNTLFQCYGAHPFLMPDDPKQASNFINGISAQYTKDIIMEVVDEKALSNTARCVLMSSVHLHLKWETTFDPKDTAPAPFNKLGKSGVVQVPMMSVVGQFKMIDSPIARAIEIPYAGGVFSMIVAMPQNNDAESWTNLTKHYVRFPNIQVPAAWTKLELPRFMINCRDNLVDLLKELGMQVPFDEDADFTVLSKDNNVKLGAVAHAAIIVVDETGINPAKAPDAIEKHFKADAPFVFGVRHNETGIMVMVGQVVDPTVD